MRLVRILGVGFSGWVECSGPFFGGAKLRGLYQNTMICRRLGMLILILLLILLLILILIPILIPILILILIPPFTPSCPASSFCTFVARPYATRITGTHPLGLAWRALGRIRSRNLARKHLALVPNRHGAARDLAHTPTQDRPLSASAHVKTTPVDPSASYPLAQNDTKVIQLK